MESSVGSTGSQVPSPHASEAKSPTVTRVGGAYWFHLEGWHSVGWDHLLFYLVRDTVVEESAAGLHGGNCHYVALVESGPDSP